MSWSGKKVSGLPELLELFRDILKTRTFDGVLGFSQGAAVAVLLAALVRPSRSKVQSS
jgi:hypothetical protein